MKNTFNKYAAGTAITENAEEGERSDEFFFASDKFGAIKNTLASKKEVGLYAEFLSRAKEIYAPLGAPTTMMKFFIFPIVTNQRN